MNRFLRWVLARCVRPADRPFLFRDLDEEFAARRAGGEADAHRWYRAQLWRSLWPSLRYRLRGLPGLSSLTPSLPDVVSIELRQAFRAWGRNPGGAVATVVTLALGIGVPTTMYSIVHGALRDLPVERGEDVMAVVRVDVGRGVTGLATTPHDFTTWRARQTAFEDLAAFSRDRVNLSDDAHLPERVAAAAITPNAFGLLGITAAAGRTFTIADARTGAPPVAIISHALWQRRFGGATDILGRGIRLNGAPHEIVGILPEGVMFPGREHVWTPLAIETSGPRTVRGQLSVFGRLRHDADLGSARAEFDAIGGALAATYPETNGDLRVAILPYTEERFGGEMAPILYTMLAIVSTVLLIACANVANLLTAQAVRRRRELAIRAALGAGRGRLLGHFVLQTGLVAGIGAGLGVAIAALGTHLFRRGMADTATLYWIDVRVDGPTLAFAIGAALLASALSAVIPVRQAWRSDVRSALAREGRGSSGFRLGRASGFLVTSEVAFSCLLLTVAGLMIKGLTQLARVEYPFPADRLLVGEIEFGEVHQADVNLRLQLTRALSERIGAEPGVEAVSFTTAPPGLSTDPWPVALGPELASPDEPTRRAHRAAVSPDYFATLQSATVAGRGFHAGDATGSEPVAIVNRSFARTFLPAGAVGQRLRFGAEDWGLATRTIVGVVPDLLMENVSAGGTVPEGVYVPMGQAFQTSAWLLVRTAGDARAALPAVRRAIAAVDPDLPLATPGRLDLQVADSIQIFRVFGRLFTVFGMGALFLASVGLHTITAFTVAQRKREIGVRIALGADPRQVTWLVLRGTMQYVAAGAAIGLGLAAIVAPILQEGFLGVGSRDPTVLLVITTTLVVVAAGAAAGPMRRARRVDPMTTLRVE